MNDADTDRKYTGDEIRTAPDGWYYGPGNHVWRKAGDVMVSGDFPSTPIHVRMDDFLHVPADLHDWIGDGPVIHELPDRVRVALDLLWSNDPSHHTQLPPSSPAGHMFINWKDSDLCLQGRCICGEMLHDDGYYLRSLQCPECRRRYVITDYFIPVPHSIQGMSSIMSTRPTRTGFSISPGLT